MVSSNSTRIVRMSSGDATGETVYTTDDGRRWTTETTVLDGTGATIGFKVGDRIEPVNTAGRGRG